MVFICRNKTPIIISHTLCNVIGKIIFDQSAGAVALFPFIIVRDRKILNNEEYIQHEAIHLRQYLETLIVGLLIIGFFQYMYALLFLKKSKLQAYYFMSHEQEAHQNDTDPMYLKKRKWFSYYKYLLPKNKKCMDLVDGKRVILDY